MAKQATSSREPRARGAQVLVVGCGSPQRRDDQSGLRVVERIEAGDQLSSAAPASPPVARLMTTESPGADLLAELDGVELLIIVDAAAASPAMPLGTWRRLTWRREQSGPLETDPHLEFSSTPAGRVCSSPSDRSPAASPHLLGVAEALHLGETLGLLPEDVWIYAIAGADFGYGDELSGGVEPVVGAVAAAVRADVDAWRRRWSVTHA